jgi:mono/diheme cytochrome c family protein
VIGPSPSRAVRSALLASAAVVVLASGCGSTDTIKVAANDPGSVKHGAELFNQRCSGCHTLDAAGAPGSKVQGQLSGGERTNGPNLSIRPERREDVLYAIRNGGFSGAIMPANIVVGGDAEAVADFVDKYAGGVKPDQGGAGGRDTGHGSFGN